MKFKERNYFIVKPNVAKIQSEICEILYNVDKQSVYDYASITNMSESYCKGCETITPNITTIETDSCALCGNTKDKQHFYIIA